MRGGQERGRGAGVVSATVSQRAGPVQRQAGQHQQLVIPVDGAMTVSNSGLSTEDIMKALKAGAAT